jgi:hypothetical protein
MECVASYSAWASENGFVSHHSYEPDLDRDATFSDGTFVVTIEERGDEVGLVVRYED